MTAWMPREGTAPPLSLPKVTAALSHEAASLEVQLQMERERADKAEARVRELEQVCASYEGEKNKYGQAFDKEVADMMNHLHVSHLKHLVRLGASQSGESRDTRPTSELLDILIDYKMMGGAGFNFAEASAATAELDRRLTADGCSRCRGER